MRTKILAGAAVALAAIAIPVASSASAEPAKTGPQVKLTEGGVDNAVLACGANVEDVPGGWNLIWQNCWGSSLAPVAPVMSNGKGNTYTLMGPCGWSPAGSTLTWTVTPKNFTPEGATFVTVTGCV